MNRIIAALVAGVFLLLVGGCGTRPHPVHSDPAAPARTDFPTLLAAHYRLPPAQRESARRAAEDAAADWRRFEAAAEEGHKRLYRSWWFREIPVLYRSRFGTGLHNALVDLHHATSLDPSFAEGWAAAGRLNLETGDLAAASAALANAMAVAEARRAVGAPLPRDLEARILTDLAWLHRERGLWQEGLARAERGLALAPTNHELLLVRGLLLAGAGLSAEALTAAATMPPARYRLRTFMDPGLKTKASAFANNWIRAMVYLQQGDAELARHALGELDIYCYRGHLPYAERYWRDAGLVAELAHDPKAPLWYAMGHLARRYGPFFPVAQQSVVPQVLDRPDVHMPVYTSGGGAHYAGGSPISYVGLQVNIAGTTLSAQRRLEATTRAADMLDILARRGVDPLFCHAVRGRLRFIEDDLPGAELELVAARALLAETGEVDAITSMMLGLIALADDRNAEAADLLAEAAEAEPDRAAAWRMLGVARARLGDAVVALQAMDRALAMEPSNLAGWYNRGVLRMQQHSWADAAADLTVAYRLDPENREVQRLLQTVAAAARAEGEPLAGDDTAGDAAVAAVDTVLRALRADLDALFAPPDSPRMAADAAREALPALEAVYAAEGDPGARRDLALAYLDAGQYRDVQMLLSGAWGIDLAPDEELMLLYADRQVGEATRAEELKRRLLAGDFGGDNPYSLIIAALVIREHDPRSPVSDLLRIYTRYSLGTKANSYGFPPLDDMTTWMRDGFARARARRTDPDLDIDPVDPPWVRQVSGSGPPPGRGVLTPAKDRGK